MATIAYRRKLLRKYPRSPPRPFGCLFSTTRAADDDGIREKKQHNRGDGDGGDGDFAHHRDGVARLNHASFGAAPRPVLEAQASWRTEWLAQPDEWYFSGELHRSLRRAARAAATTLTPPSSPSSSSSSPTARPRILEPDHVCLVENATVASCAVALYWSRQMEEGDVLIYFDIAYRACIHILQEYCRAVHLVAIEIPFAATSPEELLRVVEGQLQDLARTGLKVRFAFLDHITSQPAVLLPIREIIALVRRYNSQNNVQVCVDGAHAVGSVPNLDVPSLDCDFYFSNLHKWGFAPPTATVLWSPHLPQMRHPIVSWAWQQGLAEESLFPGTRDFSAFLAVPAAVEYLQSWRSGGDDAGKTAPEYCHDRVVAATQKLERDWGTDRNNAEAAIDERLIATQSMVRLPPELVVKDQPGRVVQERSVRDILRQDYGVEAAAGRFGEHGAYIRLSYSVYNTASDIQRLSDAIVDIVEKQ